MISMDPVRLVIREEKCLYVVTQGFPTSTVFSVEKFHVWSAKVYVVADDKAEVFLIGATNFGEHLQYRMAASTPVFDMTVGSEKGGYRLRRAADLPDLQQQP
jgi:hypothetical protein